MSFPDLGTRLRKTKKRLEHDLRTGQREGASRVAQVVVPLIRDHRLEQSAEVPPSATAQVERTSCAKGVRRPDKPAVGPSEFFQMSPMGDICRQCRTETVTPNKIRKSVSADRRSQRGGDANLKARPAP